MVKHIIITIVIVAAVELVIFVLLYLYHWRNESKLKKDYIDGIQASDIVFIKVDGKPKRFQVVAVYEDRIKVIDNMMRISAYPKKCCNILKTKPMRINEHKYLHALNLFVDHGNNERPSMSKPFIQQDYIIATDANTMIAFNNDKAKVETDENSDDLPNAIKYLELESNIDKVFEIAHIRAAIKKSKKSLIEDTKLKTLYARTVLARLELIMYL